MIDIFKRMFAYAYADTRNAELKRLAQNEYKKDWVYAYEYLKQGKVPQQ